MERRGFIVEQDYDGDSDNYVRYIIKNKNGDILRRGVYAYQLEDVLKELGQKKKYWLAQTAKQCCSIKEVEVDPNDSEFFRTHRPWLEESYEDAREHVRTYIKRYIREIEDKIEKLENERSELVNKLFNL